MDDTLTVAALAGLVAPVLVAFMTRTQMRSTYKRLTAIFVTALLAGVGMWAFYSPHTWAQAATILAAAIGVTQTVYTALKPLWDYVSDTPALTRREETTSVEAD